MFALDLAWVTERATKQETKLRLICDKHFVVILHVSLFISAVSALNVAWVAESFIFLYLGLYKGSF